MSFPQQALTELYLTENLKEAFCSISDTEFTRFFASLRGQQYVRIESTKTVEELTDLRAKVKMVSEIEGIFLGIRAEAKRNREKARQQ